jgi:hypothetical protein
MPAAGDAIGDWVPEEKYAYAVLVGDESALHGDPEVQRHGERLVRAGALTVCLVSSGDPASAGRTAVHKAQLQASRGVAHTVAYVPATNTDRPTEGLDAVLRIFVGKLLHTGLVCIDASDLRQSLIPPRFESRGEPYLAYCGVGCRAGGRRAVVATHAAFALTGLSRCQLRQIFQALVLVRHGGDMNLHELDTATVCVREAVGSGARILAGDFFDMQAGSWLEICLLLLPG